MKKNLVIRSGSLRMGGLERVLIEVVQNLDLERYNLSLIIEDDAGKENIFLGDIPKEVDVYFIKPQEMYNRTDYYRKRKKNFFDKIMYNYYMFKEHRFVLPKTLQILKKIEEKYGEIDCFIDYDWGARRYVEKLNLKKSIVWLHNSIPNLLKKKSKIKRFGKNLKKYDVIVAICDEMKAELEEIYPYLKGKVKRVYNPFNFKRILNLSEDENELTLEDKKLLKDNYIIAISRLDTVQKDYDTLIKGFKKALDLGIKEKLYIVGDGPNRKEIEELIKKNEVEDRVILLGKRKNPYVWLKRAKLFVHSSKYEGFGLVLVEAMICGKMVVSSECPTGPKEILKNGECGNLYEVGNVEELALLLDKNLKNK